MATGSAEQASLAETPDASKAVLITRNIVGQVSRIGFGSALGVVLLVISLVPIVTFLVMQLRQEKRT